MDVSVIVATRNRSERVTEFFDALAERRPAAGLSWELLIVDNGSTDETARILEREASRGRLPLRALSEPIPGKSRALNRALGGALGELLVFTDDDVEVQPGWLEGYVSAAARHPDYEGFCGRVFPRWEGTLPAWLDSFGASNLPEGLENRCDFGETTMPLPAGRVPAGLNAALRRDAARRAGPYREDLGPGTPVPYAEDIEYMRRVAAQGGRFLYVPEALVHHKNPSERMTKPYVFGWVYQVARCQVLAVGAAQDQPSPAGVPRHLWRQAVVRTLAWVAEPRPKRRLERKIRLVRALGTIRGFRQRGASVGRSVV